MGTPAAPPRTGGQGRPEPPPAPSAGTLAAATRDLGVWLRSRFRLPGRGDPAPRPGRMVGVSGWAAVLGLIGLPVAGRSSVAILVGDTPVWFEPIVVAVGLLGIGLTIGAFLAIHRRRLPWLLLCAASTLLLANLILATVAR